MTLEDVDKSRKTLFCLANPKPSMTYLFIPRLLGLKEDTPENSQ